MRKLLFLSVVILVVFLGSCKPGVPREYVQPRTMEKILYDYHIALGMAQEQYHSENERHVYEQAYKLAVLRKYDVSEEQFDASMQYYIRHTERLHAIYERLSERLEKEAVAQGVSEGEINQLGSGVAAGDTTDIWAGDKALVLMKYPSYNSYSFVIKADTSFHKGDRITMRFNTQYLMQNGTRDAVVVLAMRLSNDSIVTSYQRMMSNARQTVFVNDDKRLGIKEIRGYLMMAPDNETATTLRMLFISDIRMTRVHVETVPTDEGSDEGDDDDGTKENGKTQDSQPHKAQQHGNGQPMPALERRKP